MTKLVIAGTFLVALVQVIAFIILDRHLVVLAAGVAVAGALFGVRFCLNLRDRAEATNDDAAAGDAGETLQRWVARTQTLIAWSDASRGDWDRRLRPLLARQFELAAGQRKAKDPKAFYASGRMLFGPELWQWVDPDNVSRTGGHEPGPGRETLNDILQRLERL